MAGTDNLGRLLADCRLVVSYGVRSGRLPDSRLLAALASAETAVAAGRQDEVSESDLAMELARNIRALAPVTLEDLGSRWSPFEGILHRLMRVIMVLLASGLILATSYYSQVYTQASSILGQLTEVQAVKLREKSERLLRYYLRNPDQVSSLEKSGDDAVVFEPYLHSYEELMSSYEKLSTYVPLSLALNDRAMVPPLLADLVEKLLRGLGVELAPKGTNLKQGDNADNPNVFGQTLDELQPLLKKQGLLKGFLYALGANFPYQDFLTYQIQQTQKTVAILGIWILPALYGMLGAMLFQLKGILDPMIPNPPFERLFLCLTLGAFAGVSVFLIFGPTPNKIFDGSSSGLGAFAICFLLGFSLDVFFSILDRLVSFASQSVASLGKAPKEQPVSGPT